MTSSTHARCAFNNARKRRARDLKMAEERGALFEAAVAVVLRGWPALKMAVSHQFGGPHSQAKATWMEGATAQWMRENGNCSDKIFEIGLEMCWTAFRVAKYHFPV